jgi:hypothetical protein
MSEQAKLEKQEEIVGGFGGTNVGRILASVISI